MHDLVVLDATTVGVIVGVEADSLRVLTNQACALALHAVLCECLSATLALCGHAQLGSHEHRACAYQHLPATTCLPGAAAQGRPDKPDVRTCRLTDLKRKIVNKRATVKDGGE